MIWTWLGCERKLKQVINKIKNLYLTNPFELCEFAFSLATELCWWGINWEKGITVIDRGYWWCGVWDFDAFMKPILGLIRLDPWGVRWVRVIGVGRVICFVYLGLGREEMTVQRREERKIKLMVIGWELWGGWLLKLKYREERRERLKLLLAEWEL